MNDLIMLVFTCVIAIATVFYTIYSARLWKITKISVDISRYTGFINLMMIIDNMVNKSKEKNQPESIIYEQLSKVYGEFGLVNFLNEIDFTDKIAKDYFSKIIEVFENNNISVENISWLKPILEKIKK